MKSKLSVKNKKRHKLNPDRHFFTTFPIRDIFPQFLHKILNKFQRFATIVILKCYAVFRPFSGPKLLNLNVKFPKMFSSKYAW